MTILLPTSSFFGGKLTAGKSFALTCGSMFSVVTPVSSSLMSARVEICLILLRVVS